MNELEAYVDSLPSMLSEEGKKKLVKQWKIDNNWDKKVSEVSQQAWEGKSTEIVKIDPVVKKDAPAPGKTKASVKTEAPVDTTDSASENGSLELESSNESYNIDGTEVTKDEFDAYTEKQTSKPVAKNELEVGVVYQGTLPEDPTDRAKYWIDLGMEPFKDDQKIDRDYYNRATGVTAPNSFLIEEGQENLKGSEQLNPLSKQPDPLGLDNTDKKTPEGFFDNLMEDFNQESLSPSASIGKEFVESYIKENDLDLKYDNLYFNQKKSTNFIDKFYGGAEALKDFGINPIDFEGFLNRNGYADDYLKNLEEGEYEDTSVYGDENTLAGERTLRKYLNLYVSRQDSRENKSYKLDQIVKKGQLSGLKSSKYGGVNSTVENALNEIEVDTYFTTVDQEKQKNYIGSNFTQSTQKDKEYLQAKIDYAKKLDERGDWYAAAANTGTMIAEAKDGFVTGMRDLVNFGLDIAGFDLAVDKDTMDTITLQ